MSTFLLLIGLVNVSHASLNMGRWLTDPGKHGKSAVCGSRFDADSRIIQTRTLSEEQIKKLKDLLAWVTLTHPGVRRALEKAAKRDDRLQVIHIATGFAFSPREPGRGEPRENSAFDWFVKTTGYRSPELDPAISRAIWNSAHARQPDPLRSSIEQTPDNVLSALEALRMFFSRNWSDLSSPIHIARTEHFDHLRVGLDAKSDLILRSEAPAALAGLADPVVRAYAERFLAANLSGVIKIYDLNVERSVTVDADRRSTIADELEVMARATGLLTNDFMDRLRD